MTHSYLIWAYIALSLFDLVSTIMGLSAGATEANPIFAFLMRKLGGPWVIVAVKFLLIACVLAYSDSISPLVLWVLNVFMLVVGINNFRVVRAARRDQ